jgi:hypothetical protein
MGLAAILLALIVMALIPTQSFGMELRVAGTQLILSGPVVGDEPGKVREALASGRKRSSFKVGMIIEMIVTPPLRRDTA